jgi:Tol biopolymer transport system component
MFRRPMVRALASGATCARMLVLPRDRARVACLVVSIVLLGGCAAVPTADRTTRPATPSDSGSPAIGAAAPTRVTPSVTTEPAASSEVGGATVQPEEAGIASQRRVGEDGSGELGVFLVRPDGTGSHQLVPELDGEQWRPAWSPDGAELAFIQVPPDDTRELWIVRADGTDARRVATCERPCNNMLNPEWRPADPRGIYVGRDEGPSKFMLSRLDLDTGVVTDVVVREDGQTAENWRLSPDGTEAAFTRAYIADDSHAAVFVVNLATGTERQLTPYAYSLDIPEWLPGGRILFNSPSLGVYNQGDAEAANLWVVDVDGRNLEQLTHYTGKNSGATLPQVLPGGSGIVFTKVLDGTLIRPTAIVDLDGGNERFLTPNQSRGSHIDIRPLP